MRLLLVTLSIVVFCGGCTHTALQRRTVAQASTLTDLQHQQVLDNLAMFRCNRAAMPWHAKLKGGLISVTDQGTGEFSTMFPGQSLLLNAQRGILAQWEMDPTVEADDLVPLALAYERAAYPEFLNEDSIRDKICEIAVRFDVLPNNKTLAQILKDKGAEETIKTHQKAICDMLDADAPDASCKKLDPTLSKRYHANRKQMLNFRWQELEETRLAVTAVIAEAQLPKPMAESDGQIAVRKIDRSPIMSRALGRINAAPSNSVDDVNPPKRTMDVGFSEMTENERLLFALHLVCEEKYHPPAWVHEPSQRNVGLVAQAEDKIESLQKLLDESAFFTQWFGCGSKKDVPKCACYVGHHYGCGCDCYVWVEPQHMETLKKLTLIVLDLAPAEKPDIFPRGAGYSPTLSRSR